MKKAINDCLRMGNQYLDHKQRSEQRSIKDLLQQVADRCSLKFFYDNSENSIAFLILYLILYVDIDSILGEDPVVATASLYSSTFVVDVMLTSKGIVYDVNGNRNRRSAFSKT